MTPREALERAVDEMHEIPYVMEIGDRWESLREMLAARGADCDGHAAGCVERTAMLLKPLVPNRLVFVVGDVRQRGGAVPFGLHAWVELAHDGEVLWADPTPGYPRVVAAPSWWKDRTPLWGAMWDGRIFAEAIEYAPRADG